MEDASVKRTAVPIFGGAVRLAQRLHLDTRAAKSDCKICKEWQIKYRTQSKKFFFEAEHLRRAIRKTLDQCQLFLPAASFKLFEESLQLDVRFFSEHNVGNILEEEEPLVMPSDAGEVERLKEKIDYLSDEIEKLESQNLKLKSDLNFSKEQVRMENVARQMNSALKTAARENTYKPIMHAAESQTDELWWQGIFDEVEDLLGPSLSVGSQEDVADEGKRRHSFLQRLSIAGASATAAKEELAKVKAERDLLQTKLEKAESQVKSLAGGSAEAVAGGAAPSAAAAKAADRKGSPRAAKRERGRKASPSPAAAATERPRTPASLKEVATNTDELRWEEYCTAEQRKVTSPTGGRGPRLSVVMGVEERASTASDSARGGEALSRASSGRFTRRVSTPLTEPNMALAPKARHRLSSVDSAGKESTREAALDFGDSQLSRERPVMVDKCVGVSEWDGLGEDPIERSLGCKGSQVLVPPTPIRRTGKAYSKDVRSTPNLGAELLQHTTSMDQLQPQQPRSAPAKSGNAAVKVPSDREPIGRAWVPGEVRPVKSASLTKLGSKRWTHEDEAEPYLLHVWEANPYGHKKPSRTELVSLGAIMPPKKKFGETW